MATKYKLAEQIMSLLRGGAPSIASRIKMPEIMTAVGQAINKILKTEFYTTHIAEERNANGLVSAYYEKVPVEKWNNSSRSVLPATPVKLLMNQGIYQINKPGCRHDPFIPVPNGMSAFLPSEPIISDLFGQISYEVVGSNIIYSKDLIANGVKEVEMQLVVNDIDSLGDHDPLPVPGDGEMDVIQAVYNLLSRQNVPDQHIDSNAEYKVARQ